MSLLVKFARMMSSIIKDIYYSNVSLLLTGDDLLDHSSPAKGLSVFGNTSVSTSVKKYGTGSIYFDGNGDYISTATNIPAYAFGAGDFTIELWYQPTSKPSPYPAICANVTGGFGGNNYALSDRHGFNPTKFSVWIGNISVGSAALVSTTSVVDGTWYHLAFVRNGTNISLYVNGINESSATTSVALNSSTSDQLAIGMDGANAGSLMNGYVDDFRITKGVARYTANFTPPTSAFPTS